MNFSTMAAFRKALGLSQQDMGLMLHMYRDQYASCETRRRNFSVKSLLALAEVQLMLQKEAPPTVLYDRPRDVEAMKTWLNRQEAKVAHTINQVRMKLKSMEKEYDTALHFMGILEREQREGPTTVLKGVFLKIALKEQQKRLERSGLVHQAKRKTELAGLEAQLASLRERIALSEAGD